jgi:hypothetical protein
VVEFTRSLLFDAPSERVRTLAFTSFQTEHSMPINLKRVLLGGLAAGVVLNIIDFVVFTFILGDRMKADANAFVPGLGDAMMGGSPVPNMLMNLIIGFLLVWTYAAIRPRFGPGANTAIYSAVLFWILGGIFNSGYLVMGMMSKGLWWTYAAVYLVTLIISSIVGASVYKEDAAVAATV